MATKAYHVWDAAGRPWRLARPIADVQAWARSNGVTVLGTIGNEEHLQASTPEDHTPFSATAWPLPLTGYVVWAIDLDDVNELGPAILAEARAGGMKWLKYCNIRHRHYTYRDGFQSSVYNSDAHIHLSGRTDHDVPITFDPFGDDDMATAAGDWTGPWIMQRLSEMADIEIPPNTELGYPGYSAPNKLAAEIRAIRAAQTAPAPVEVDYAKLAEAMRPIIREEINKTRFAS